MKIGQSGYFGRFLTLFRMIVTIGALYLFAPPLAHAQGGMEIEGGYYDFDLDCQCFDATAEYGKSSWPGFNFTVTFRYGVPDQMTIYCLFRSAENPEWTQSYIPDDHTYTNFPYFSTYFQVNLNADSSLVPGVYWATNGWVGTYIYDISRPSDPIIPFEPQRIAIKLTVVKGNPSITLPNPGNQLLTNVVVLSASSSCKLPLTLSVESGPAVLSDGSNLTFTGFGPVKIKASQAGDSNWNAAEVTRTFQVQPQLTMAAQPDSGGLIGPVAGNYGVNLNSANAITATANNGYHFLGWQASEAATIADTNAVTTTVVLTSNATVTALFELNSLAVLANQSIVTVPEGGPAIFNVKLSAQGIGDVTLAVARQDGDPDISVTSSSVLTFTPFNWNDYQTVTLAAAEDSDNLNGEAHISITAAGVTGCVVTAVELDDDCRLVLSATNGAVLTQLKPPAPGLVFEKGTELILTAVPDPGFRFFGWAGDATGIDTLLDLTIDSDKSVTALFTPTAPKVFPPRTIAKRTFTARWQWVAAGAPEGELSVAADEAFNQPVPGYEGRYVVNQTECLVTNLAPDTDYWYRVRRLTAWSGAGDWSLAERVHTGTNMPVFPTLLLDAPVSVGSCQVEPLDNLKAGGGKLSILSSDTNNLKVLSKDGLLYLHYLWRGTDEVVTVTVSARDRVTGYRPRYQAILRKVKSAVAVVGKGPLTKEGNRLTQDVTLENRSGETLFGVRFRADGLASNVWLVNRTGFGPYSKDPLRDIPCVWAAGSQMVIHAAFDMGYAKQSHKNPADYWVCAILPLTSSAMAKTFGLPVTRDASYEGGPARLIGLPVIGNRTYQVLFSEDKVESWTPAGTPVRATANDLQWLDLEGTPSRSYKVQEVMR